jgi:hypothetical protein
MERKLIRDTGANNPAIGHNLTPPWQALDDSITESDLNPVTWGSARQGTAITSSRVSSRELDCAQTESRLGRVVKGCLELHCVVGPAGRGVPLGNDQPDTAWNVELGTGQNISAVQLGHPTVRRVVVIP